jgi:hypothetical protein
MYVDVDELQVLGWEHGDFILLPNDKTTKELVFLKLNGFGKLKLF